METKVLIAVPTLGWVKTELAARLEEYRGDRRVMVRYLSNVQDVAAARNEIAMYHFSSVAFTHLLMLDADTVPPGGFLDRMLDVNRPVVSGVTWAFRPAKPNCPPPLPVLALWERQATKGNGEDLPTYERVVAIPERGVLERKGLVSGCFCMLVWASALEELATKGYPLFKTLYVEETQEKLLSEDLYFCQRLESSGYRISVLCDLVCEHYKTISVADVARYGESVRQWAVEREGQKSLARRDPVELASSV